MRGAALCLLSAAAFGTLGIFGRLASDAGADTATTLLVRFGLAALVFAAVLAWTGGWRALRGLSRRVVLTGLALGAAGYSLQSGLYFAAIGRLDVSLVALLLYTYPAFVTIAALALGRLAPSPRIGAALTLASAGLVLVLVAAGTGAFDVTGALMAIGASLTYTTYILVSDGIVGDVDPFALALPVLTGATVTGGSNVERIAASDGPTRRSPAKNADTATTVLTSAISTSHSHASAGRAKSIDPVARPATEKLTVAPVRTSSASANGSTAPTIPSETRM